MNQVITLPVEFELSVKPGAVMDALYKMLGARFVESPELSQKSAISPSSPDIGEYWAGMGGIYAGVARGRDGEPDYHLILCKEDPKKDCTWQAALDLAKTITADGHSDFSVPTRFESALLYANLHDQFEADRWHWTSTQYSEDSAWFQYFVNGGQGSSGKSPERRVRFVRRTSIL